MFWAPCPRQASAYTARLIGSLIHAVLRAPFLSSRINGDALTACTDHPRTTATQCMARPTCSTKYLSLTGDARLSTAPSTAMFAESGWTQSLDNILDCAVLISVMCFYEGLSPQPLPGGQLASGQCPRKSPSCKALGGHYV